MTGLDIGVYVPQMGFSYHDVLHRALRCEELGIGSDATLELLASKVITEF